MQSPAPVAKNIRRGGSESAASGGNDEEFAIDIIENIEAITTDQDQVNAGEDSSGSTITEDNNPSPGIGGGIIVGQEEGNTHTDRDIGTGEIGPRVDLSSDSDSSSSSSTSSRSTDSSKSDSDSDSSSNSSDSDCYYSDSEDSDKSNYKYKNNNNNA